MVPKKASYAEWLSDFGEDACRRPLTDDERAVFAREYQRSSDAALRLGCRVARMKKKESWDVVYGALTRMIRAVTEGGAPRRPRGGEPGNG